MRDSRVVGGPSGPRQARAKKGTEAAECSRAPRLALAGGRGVRERQQSRRPNSAGAANPRSTEPRAAQPRPLYRRAPPRTTMARTCLGSLGSQAGSHSYPPAASPPPHMQRAADGTQAQRSVQQQGGLPGTGANAGHGALGPGFEYSHRGRMWQDIWGTDTQLCKCDCHVGLHPLWVFSKKRYFRK
ncbi:hypothetical protein NDU88_001325 [Pleurodeles waltl]|uniref:Uncharacterized protein n=1 Tax=Pleurodeles waltl TaxID=8319 RepID=A0AAV7RCN9_PLEWA|nr:hypothetical protein NDU88_001325 [Pleurodeles waltl]